MKWDKEKVKSILPQREPFLFVDEVLEIEEGKRIVAKKYLDPEADFFKGHFPGKPIMPGVLIIEAMAAWESWDMPLSLLITDSMLPSGAVWACITFTPVLLCREKGDL